MKPRAGWPCWAVAYLYPPPKERTWEAERMLFPGHRQEETPKTIITWLRLVQIYNWGHAGLVMSPQQSLILPAPRSPQQSLGEISLSHLQDVAPGRFIPFCCDRYSKQWRKTKSLIHCYGKIWHHCQTKKDTAVTIPTSSVLAANMESKLM